jgi:hypothetical protein
MRYYHADDVDVTPLGELASLVAEPQGSAADYTASPLDAIDDSAAALLALDDSLPSTLQVCICPHVCVMGGAQRAQSASVCVWGGGVSGCLLYLPLHSTKTSWC